MGIYSPYEVYPSWYDEMEECPNAEHCIHANGDCFNAGFCLMEKILED